LSAFTPLRALKRKGHEVVALVRSAEKAQRLFAQYGVVVDCIAVGSIARMKKMCAMHCKAVMLWCMRRR
jgi:predicted glycosyltransferase